MLDVTTERYYSFWHTVATLGIIGGVMIVAELAIVIFFLWRASRG